MATIQECNLESHGSRDWQVEPQEHDWLLGERSRQTSIPLYVALIFYVFAFL